MASHSWEQPDRGHSWEADDDGALHVVGWDDSDDESSAAEGAGAVAGVEMVEHLLQLYYLSKMSARDLCVACYWAGLAGVEAAREVGMAPGKPTGRYQRHLDAVLGTGSQKGLYFLDVPGHGKHDVARTVHDLPVRPPHELIEAELQSDRSISLRLREAIEDEILPPAYFNHEVVKGAPGELVLPLILYVDA
eukprot:10614670-Alexandrium_andersonii.AAC.1